MKPKCVCGCKRQRGVQFHHAIYKQEIRKRLLSEHKAANIAGPPDTIRERQVLADRRNLVPVGPKCHANHHSRVKPLALTMLPDSVYEFAEELMGAGPAYEYLRRRYAGSDPRLEALLSAASAD